MSRRTEDAAQDSKRSTLMRKAPIHYGLQLCLLLSVTLFCAINAYPFLESFGPVGYDFASVIALLLPIVWSIAWAYWIIDRSRVLERETRVLLAAANLCVGLAIGVLLSVWIGVGG